jgi:hypothetical protein
MMAVLSSFVVPSRKGLEACGDGALRWRDARHCSMRRALSGADDDIGACSVVSDAPVACESVSHRAVVVVRLRETSCRGDFQRPLGLVSFFPSF